MEQHDLENLKVKYNDILEEYFVANVREFAGRAVTKDNYEDLYIGWLNDLDESQVNLIISSDTISKLKQYE